MPKGKWLSLQCLTSPQQQHSDCTGLSRKECMGCTLDQTKPSRVTCMCTSLRMRCSMTRAALASLLVSDLKALLRASVLARYACTGGEARQQVRPLTRRAPSMEASRGPRKGCTATGAPGGPTQLGRGRLWRPPGAAAVAADCCRHGRSGVLIPLHAVGRRLCCSCTVRQVRAATAA